MITIWRVLKAGFVNFGRNGILSLASTTIMVLMLFFVSLALFFSLAVNKGVEVIRNKIDISAYLNDTTTEKEILGLQEEIANLSEVKSVKYVSKEEALSRFKEQNSGNKKLLESLEGIENPLPASLEIKVYDPEKLEALSQTLEKEEYKEQVRKVSYKENKLVIDKITSGTKKAAIGSLIFAVVFGVVAVIIVFITVRVAIFSQRDDIEIMRLVGATNWFIRGPFVVEGAIYGIISPIFASMIMAALLFYAGPSLVNYAGTAGTEINNYLRDNSLVIFGTQLLVGILIGAISSWLALRRHLKF